MEEGGPEAEEERLCALLDAVDQYLRLQADLEAALREGFLDLARARYSMGSHNVGAAQYPARMMASAGVAHSGELFQACVPRRAEKGASPHVPRPQHESASLPDQRTVDSNGARVASSQDLLANASWDPPSGAAAHASTTEDIISELARKFASTPVISDEEPGMPPKSKDHTLRWFGGMVSPHLRASREKFEASLQVVIALANASLAVQKHLSARPLVP